MRAIRIIHLMILMPATSVQSLPFCEDFNAGGPLNSVIWARGGDVSANSNPMQDINDLSMPDEYGRFVNVVTLDGDNDPVLLIGDGDGNGSDFLYAEAKFSFARGNNLVCQFQTWGNSSNPGSVNGDPIPWTFPGNSPYGPWHCDPDGADVNGPVDLAQSKILGGLGDGSVATQFKFIDNCTWQSGPNVEIALKNAFHTATTRANALWIRVWLGDTDGAYGEWSDDNGATWTPFKSEAGTVIDTRDSGTNATDPAWLAFGATRGGGYRIYDNIYVGDDNSPPPDPRDVLTASVCAAGPTPTPTPEPAIGSTLVPQWSSATMNTRSDIRNLSSHFKPGEGPGNWEFHTSTGRRLSLGKHERDLKDHFISTEIHPGLLTIRHSGADEQIKGTIGRPIGISEFHKPWEFELEVLRDFWTVSSSKQSNLAYGLNVALTFSDPSNWPADITRWPPDTHWFQLLIVHLGTRGSSGGLPQYGVHEHGGGAMGERWLVWGRGDLDPSGKLNGDWGIPTIITGDGRQDHGPASTAAYLNFTLHSPTLVSFGIRFGQDRGFYTHEVPIYQADVSRWGKVTGAWEVGPVIAESSWILNQWPGSYIHGSAAYGGWSLKTEPTSKGTELYVGFCDFQYSPWGILPSIEVMTNDFNIPGYIGQRWQTEFDGVTAETWSHPGYLTLTSRGINNYWGGTIGQADLQLSFYPPPWEFEMCVLSPDDNVPWNIHLGLGVVDVEGKSRGGWTPGILNIPGEGRQVGNISIRNNFTPAGSTSGGQIMGDVQVTGGFGPGFPEGIPKDILDSNPIYLMARVIDSRRLQMGVRAGQDDPWFLTPVYDCGFDIRGFWQNAISMYSGRGAVDYTQLLIDYWHYREGLSGPIQ